MKCTLCGGEARRLSVIYEAAQTTVTTVTNTAVTENKGYGNQQVQGSSTVQNTSVTFSPEGLKAAPPIRVAFHAYSFNGGGAFSKQLIKFFKNPIFLAFFFGFLALVLVTHVSYAIINYSSEIVGLGSYVMLVINGLLNGLFLIAFPLWLIVYVRSRPEAKKNNEFFKDKYNIAFAEHEKKQDEIYLNWKNSWKCQACGEVFIHYL